MPFSCQESFAADGVVLAWQAASGYHEGFVNLGNYFLGRDLCLTRLNFTMQF